MKVHPLIQALFMMQVRYVSRKRLAESRPRVRGQFVKAGSAAAVAAAAAAAAAPTKVPHYVPCYICWEGLTCEFKEEIEVVVQSGTYYPPTINHYSVVCVLLQRGCSLQIW